MEGNWIKKCADSLFLFFVQVGLFFILLAPCLTVGTIPEEQNDQSYCEQAVGDGDGGHDGDDGLGEVIIFKNNPRVDAAVVAREGLSPLGQVLVLVSEHRAGDVGRVAAALDVDKQGGVSHRLVLQLVVSRQVDPLWRRDHVDSGAVLPRAPAVEDAHLVALVHVGGAALAAAAPEAVALSVLDVEGADLAGDGHVYELVQ